MVGFDPHRLRELSKTEYAIAGGFSGFVTRFLCQPLDVIKIRLQLQIEPINFNPSSKYHSITHTLITIVKEEGITALWKGHIPAQGLSIIFGLVQFTSFEFLTKKVWIHLPHSLSTDWKPATHFVIGSASGCIATLAGQPMDVIRTRFVGQGEPKVYKTLISAVNSMYVHEGPRSFYKGLVPALLQIAPHTGLQFGFYALIIQIWNLIFERSNSEVGSVQSFVSGSAAGVFAKTIVYPLDVLKKRLQIQGFEEVRRSFGQVRHYRGLAHFVWLVGKEEGLRGFYKGYTPSMIKAATTTGLHFSVYEYSCQFLQKITY